MAEHTKDCPYCAEPIKAQAIKCKHCGERLNESSSRKRLPIVLAACAVGLVLSFALAYTFVASYQADTQRKANRSALVLFYTKGPSQSSETKANCIANYAEAHLTLEEYTELASVYGKPNSEKLSATNHIALVMNEGLASCGLVNPF